ncbi:MAG TPA: Gfo/Idh/MocA family oxidoreductase [Planctomycetota bacterium]|nr:Gfo/Idh/MocA family oxidoreductase [Planctomycetota bacterium]
MHGWRRLAIAGAGSRGEWWTREVARRFSDRIEIVAICDRNPGRAKRLAGVISEHGQKPDLYGSDGYRRMLAEKKPDVVLIAVPDKDHGEYAVDAMRGGADALVEKPLAASVDDTRAILKARRETGKRCVVTFNMRWAPSITQLKDILMTGVIGVPVAATMQWLLNTSHGADYFRRWHRNLANSGGLLVHKSTHHFDTVNWLMDSTPTAVFARGSRRFYRPETAVELGLSGRGERCLECPVKAKCPYPLDLQASQGLREVYLENEGHDGYQRDRCIFSSEIDIPDSMSVAARFASGAYLTYSLQAFSPWEGFTLAIDGTRGRLEHRSEDGVGATTRVLPLNGPAQNPAVWVGEGQHGGADDPLIDSLFGDERPADRWGRHADERAGAWSALVGLTANASIAQGREIQVSELVPELFETATRAGA